MHKATTTRDLPRLVVKRGKSKVFFEELIARESTTEETAHMYKVKLPIFSGEATENITREDSVFLHKSIVSMAGDTVLLRRRLHYAEGADQPTPTSLLWEAVELPGLSYYMHGMWLEDIALNNINGNCEL